MEGTNRRFKIKNNIDIIAAFGVIGIVLMIIIPLPSSILDVLLALNITFLWL